MPTHLTRPTPVLVEESRAQARDSSTRTVEEGAGGGRG
jgi:hypothetical protein